MGVRLSSEAATSLQQLLALQLNEHLKKIEVISNSATQEMALENSLLRMKNQWTQVSLPVENYRYGLICIILRSGFLLFFDFQSRRR